jgi:NAD(P)-dependent dehydrogenase (short-subunit alcohol dehydrogenase family)
VNSNQKSETWLVTGASRGIGLEMVKQLLSSGRTVIGACRNPDGARDLWEIQSDYKTRFRPLKLDVSDSASIDAAAKSLSNTRVDVLVNNAGILRGAAEPLSTLNVDDVIKSFVVNAVGPLQVTRAFLPHLQQSSAPKVIQLTSRMGSIDDNKSGGYYGYRMSKTALNMFNRSFAADYKTITTIVMHPGWVKTDMGGHGATAETYDSVKGMLSVIDGLSLGDSGRFLDYRGQDIHW